jgi:molybdopterin/thiamine biosynthesis adenylyltransferase
VKRVALALPERVWRELTPLLGLSVETAAVMLCGVAECDGEIILLGRHLILVANEYYERRESCGLSIASMGYVPSLKRAADDQSVAIFIHTHPNGAPVPSEFDEEVDRQIRSLFMLRTSQPYYGSLILGGTPADPSFSGQVHSGEGSMWSVGRVRIVGRMLRLLTKSEDEPSSGEAFDRQVRAFGRDGQKRLSKLRVGVVGVGGTGSSVCEQLIRLGVRELSVVDDDCVTETNVSRLYGSGLADIGTAKVEIVRRNAEAIGLGTSVTPILGRVTDKEVVKALRGCDVIFGCTDDHAGRAVLSRFAYWYLMPLIDTGVLISSVGGIVRGLYGRVTTVMPGAACLICRGRVEAQNIRNEMLPPAERVRLAREGYAPGLADPDPSVVAYTTMVAAFAVNECLERLIGYGGEYSPTEIILRIHEREVRRNSATATPNHYCADLVTWGRGDLEPFLGQVWAE